MISRLDQARLLAHPLRLRLFEAFALEPRTTHQVAQALGLSPTRLYHHVNALQRVGLLELKETRQVRGATEKYYQAAGRTLEVEPGLFAREREGTRGGAGGGRVARTRDSLSAMAVPLLEGTRLDLIQALDRYGDTPEPLQPVAARMIVYASPAKLAALRRRLLKWMEPLTRPKAGKPGKKKRGTAQGASRASLTLIFTAGPGSRGGTD
jgi:DNA-binding transcriptional ArsR family regulator